MKGSVVFVETPSGHGSGWVVERGFIITNQHVVAGAATVTLRTASRGPVLGQVVATDSRHDIALVSYNTAALDPPPLGTRTLAAANIGEPLVVLGYALTGVWPDGTVGAPAAKIGALSQIVDLGPEGLNLQVDAVMDPGDSGGPVVDIGGMVVGMNRATIVATGSGQRVVGVFFAVPVDQIMAVLPTLKAGTSIQ